MNISVFGEIVGTIIGLIVVAAIFVTALAAAAFVPWSVWRLASGKDVSLNDYRRLLFGDPERWRTGACRFGALICPYCRHMISKSVALRGQIVICPACGGRFRAGRSFAVRSAAAVLKYCAWFAVLVVVALICAELIQFVRYLFAAGN